MSRAKRIQKISVTRSTNIIHCTQAQAMESDGERERERLTEFTLCFVAYWFLCDIEKKFIYKCGRKYRCTCLLFNHVFLVQYFILYFFLLFALCRSRTWDGTHNEKKKSNWNNLLSIVFLRQLMMHMIDWNLKWHTGIKRFLWYCSTKIERTKSRAAFYEKKMSFYCGMRKDRKIEIESREELEKRDTLQAFSDPQCE